MSRFDRIMCYVCAALLPPAIVIFLWAWLGMFGAWD